MLQELVITMQKSKQDTAKMDMWVYNDEYLRVKPTNYYSCGYAACVIGDHIIRTKEIPIPITFNTYQYINNNSDIYVDLLETACIDLFNNAFLVKSIYYSCEASRYDFALFSHLFDSGIFGNGELKSFAHLRDENPKPEDVAIYVKACIEKIQNYTN